VSAGWAVAVWLLLLAWPAIAVIIDGVAGVRAHGLRYDFSGAAQEDFRVLVPIWGDVRYLINADALDRYGSRVTLVTTGDETPEFYEQLNRVARAHRFEVWRDKPRHDSPGVQKRRSTSRPVRDKLIRNVLAAVTEPYVIPLDADSFPGGPLGYLAGELERRGLAIASVRIMPANRDESVLTRLQFFEYWLSMQIRFIAPWLVSGACQVARTPVLRDIMSRHSLFFQGNDVEIGLLAEARGFPIGHIAFEVTTDVPARLDPWLRQRLAWAGGQFRLFIVNIWFARRHPFLWFYGAGVATAGLAFRWQVAASPPGPLLWAVAAGYAALVVYLYLRRGGGNGWVIAMPLYVLLSSFLILPLGPAWYVKMSLAHRNWGIIRPGRRREGYQVPPRKAVRYGFRRAAGAKITTSLASIVIIVVGLGATITGGFTRLPSLPSGIVTGTAADVTGRNVLADPPPWRHENLAAIPPTYRKGPGGQEILYAGQPGDAVPLASGTRRIEIFLADVGYPAEQQGMKAGVRPGQRWRFQVTVRGFTVKAYVVVGMEWFSLPKKEAIYLGEADVYPHISEVPEQVTVTCPPLPGSVKAIAVYVQLQEISPATRIDVTVSSPYLVRVKLPDNLAGAPQGHRRHVGRLDIHAVAAGVVPEAGLRAGRRAHLRAAGERAAGAVRRPERDRRVAHGQARGERVAGAAVHLEAGPGDILGAAGGQRDAVAAGYLVPGCVGIRGARRQRHVVAVREVEAPGRVAVAVAVPHGARCRCGGS
jgi:hypothetical protein